MLEVVVVVVVVVVVYKVTVQAIHLMLYKR